ncbi:MAG: hypothetical protein E7019_05785 [Alphaproteobacteria bacterium]|nr:hypothetical protein [Alphaproteobacteria bacterium]
MSISSTRKIGTSTSAPRTERGYVANGKNSQFVEHIDTQNNVLVRDDTDGHSNNNNYFTKQNQEQEQNSFTPSSAYVPNSVNAIASSELLDSHGEYSHSSHMVGIYDNNQSIIKDEELERTGRNYLKHFYEKNEHLIDVDKLV